MRLRPAVRVTATAVARSLALGLSTTACFAQTTTEALLAPQRQAFNIVWEVAPSPVDRMSTIDPAEARRYPMLGPTYYLASRASAGTRPLYRVVSATGDHAAAMEVLPGETLESTLGYLWSAKNHPAGSAPVWSIFDPKTGDHGLNPPGPPPRGYQATALQDAYGWPRYGRAPALLMLKGRQITVASNLAAGGALWSLEWGGEQFVDQLDYGRGIQSSLSFAGAGASTALPTEGGDQTADPDPSFLHGSPTLSSSNCDTPAGRVQSTRAIPLEWRPAEDNGGKAGQGIAYPAWQLGKDLTLDDPSLRLGADHPSWPAQVIRYTTIFVNGGPALPQADIEIPTAYLKPAFRRSFTCDATREGAGALQEVFGAQFTPLSVDTWHHQFDAKAGGVILSNDGLTHALGLYGISPEQGGSGRYFTLWRFGTLVRPTVNKISIAAGPRMLANGTNAFQSWIVVGNAPEVCAIMHRLYAHGLR